MGGLGSGRWKKDRARKTVESCWLLDVNKLSEMGCLKPGCTSTCQWTDSEVFSIKLRAEAERLHLCYKVRAGVGEWENMAEIISLVHVPCRFGGSRFFFICPGRGDGSTCERRTIKLHLSRRQFLCRHCNKLAYRSQYERPWQRALRKADKLKQRLGMDVGIVEPFPDKPRGMWASTYGRLLDEILQGEILANEAKVKMFKRLAQVKNDVE